MTADMVPAEHRIEQCCHCGADIHWSYHAHLHRYLCFDAHPCHQLDLLNWVYPIHRHTWPTNEWHNAIHTPLCSPDRTFCIGIRADYTTGLVHSGKNTTT